jgi:hypothetical protein
MTPMRAKNEAEAVPQGFVNCSQQTGTFSMTWKVGRSAESDSRGLGQRLRFYNSNTLSCAHF